jgi:DNA-directed RNA polymerase specialized sigma24 family protein
MSPFAPLSLNRFNQQVFACQDEAFTLAFSLLADETAACEVVQEVFLRAYSNYGNGDIAVAVKVLQGVILMCRRGKWSKTRNTKEWIPGWNQLEHDEQEALLLVDVLGKSYLEAALVLNTSEHDLAVIVAHGRCTLTRCFNPEPELR